MSDFDILREALQQDELGEPYDAALAALARIEAQVRQAEKRLAAHHGKLDRCYGCGWRH